jgi:large subunit ribosomal protein L13
VDSNKKNIGTIVVDGDNHIAGRLSSYTAKSLLEGNRVVILNAERVLISGKKKSIIDEELKKLEISSIINPKYGPFHPRRPDTILTRMIRGMVPRRKPKGLEAMKRLRVYIGEPENFKLIKKVTFEKALAKKPLPFYLPLSELAKRLGWKEV